MAISVKMSSGYFGCEEDDESTMTWSLVILMLMVVMITERPDRCTSFPRFPLPQSRRWLSMPVIHTDAKNQLSIETLIPI